MAKVNYRKANRAIQEIIDYIYSIEDVWNDEKDLKLYDVFFEQGNLLEETIAKRKYSENRQSIIDKLNIENLFYDFCEIRYNRFKDYMDGNGIDYEKQKCYMFYIGHTSSFYLSSFRDSFTYAGNRNGERIINISRMLESICGCYLNISDKKTYPICADPFSYQEQLDNDFDDLVYIISGKALNDIKDYFNDAMVIYFYITQFKENQKDYYREYLEDVCDNILYDIETEKEEQEKEKIEMCMNTCSCIIV